MRFNPNEDHTREEINEHLTRCLKDTKGRVAHHNRSMRIRRIGEMPTYWARLDEPVPTPRTTR